MTDTDVVCSHLGMINSEVAASSPDKCLQCVDMGDVWVNLRLCMICGQVGCCDNSKNTHATKHFHSDGHGIIRSHQPGEDWYWCYVDEVMFTVS